MNLLFFALSLILYYILHSLLAHTKIKALFIPRIISKKYYRLFFNLISIVLLLPLLALYKKVDPNIFFGNILLEMIGFGMAVSGFFLSIYAFKQYDLLEFIGIQQLNYEKPPSPELKISGFNSVVRHPLYFSGLLIIWGFFLFHPSDLILTIATITTIYLYFGTILEERKLIATFGESYKKYQQEVPMLLPFLKFKK